MTQAPISPGACHTAYGQRGSSWSWDRVNGQGKHGGEDWHNNQGMAEIGKSIRAICAGRVIYAGRGAGWRPAFGNHVLVESTKLVAGETIRRTTVYAHMDRLPKVRYGQIVKVGQVLGELGMTGNVSGPHLHLEQHLGQGWGDPRRKPHYESKPKPPSKAGLYAVKAKAGVVIRTAPDLGKHTPLRRDGKILRRPKGYKIRIVSTKTVDGVTFGKSTNYWYTLSTLTKTGV